MRKYIRDFKYQIGSKIKFKNKSNDADIINISDFPDIVLETIFLHLTGKDLIKNVIHVCKHWNNLIENEAFWMHKCIVDNKLTLKQAQFLHQMNIFNSKKYFFGKMMNKNLLRNPCGNQRFNNWYNPKKVNISDIEFFDSKAIKRLVNSFTGHAHHMYLDSWTIEKKAQLNTEAYTGSSNSKKSNNFVTHMDSGEKIQIIDLNKDLDVFEFALLNLSLSNNLGLKLKISDNYLTTEIRYVYMLKVLLISENYEIIDAFSFIDCTMTYYDLTLQPKTQWKHIHHTFKITKPFRYILFYHAGKDIMFQYLCSNRSGIKMTNSSVQFSN